MSTAVTCSECGSPVYTEDRFCGACGAQVALAAGDPAMSASSAEHAAKRLNELRSLTAGEYEIRGEIGRGGMAVVYLAYDLRLNRKVAIKAMLPDLAFHAGMEERFKREARTAARLDHPNIVVIHSVRDSGDPLFFVMKYVDGAPLDKVVRAHAPLPIPVVQGLLLQLCAALQYAHDDGVVHRDVKPANILIDTRGNVQVTDFGIAKAADASNLTRTGTTIGTPAYMCPEQCLGKPQGFASDQYSVGVVAYELITGLPPFTGSDVETQWAHVREAPPWITQGRADCPEPLATAVMRMLAKEPRDRWPSLRDAMPLIGAGLSADAEGGRPAMLELVRTTPTTRPSLALTPPSPVPQQVVRKPTPPVAERGVTTPVPAEGSAVASLDVTPRQFTLEVGTTERMRCRVLDAQRREMHEEPSWSSSDPEIASVDEAGVVTAHRAGTVKIAAMVDGLTSMVSADVVPATVARLDVEPNVVSVRERGSVQLQVRAYTEKKKTVSNPAVTFQSADPSVATIDRNGRLSGLAPGRTTAVVSVGDVSVTVIITVDPVVNATLGVAATPKPSRVNTGMIVGIAAAVIAAVGIAMFARRSKPDAPVPLARPTTSAGTVASPPAAAPAAPTVVAKVSPSTPAAPVAIPTDTTVATIELTDPSPLGVDVGATRSLIARVLNKGGELLPTVPVGWESSNPAVATVDVDGVLSATSVGRTLVTAKVGDLTRVLAVDVREAASARVAAATTDTAAAASAAAKAGADSAAARAPSESDMTAVADSVLLLINRRVVRLDRLMQADAEAGGKFRQFLDANEPSAKLGPKGPSATGERVAFGVVLEWGTDTTHRERTVNVEAVLEPVQGGWAIREVRFPSGFKP